MLTVQKRRRQGGTHCLNFSVTLRVSENRLVRHRYGSEQAAGQIVMAISGGSELVDDFLGEIFNAETARHFTAEVSPHAICDRNKQSACLNVDQLFLRSGRRMIAAQ